MKKFVVVIFSILSVLWIFFWTVNYTGYKQGVKFIEGRLVNDGEGLPQFYFGCVRNRVLLNRVKPSQVISWLDDSRSVNIDGGKFVKMGDLVGNILANNFSLDLSDNSEIGRLTYSESNKGKSEIIIVYVLKKLGTVNKLKIVENVNNCNEFRGYKR